MTSFFSRIGALVATHKKKAIALVVVLAVVGYYTTRGSATATAKYVVGQVTRGTLVAAVSGSGQIEASQQVDVKAKASGDVTAVYVKAGQTVRAGTVLAYLDASDAQKAVRDADINLQSAQITLQKLQRSQTSGTATTTDDLERAYQDAFNKVSDAFLQLPDVMDTARAVLYDTTVKGGCTPNVCEYGNLINPDDQFSFKAITTQVESDYAKAKAAYDPNFASYRLLRVDATHQQVTDILATTQRTLVLMAQAVKGEQNMLDTLISSINDQAAKVGGKGQIPSQITAYQSSISSAIGTINSIVSGLATAERSIESTQRSLDDSTLSDPMDLATAQNTVRQRQASLDDARAALADYAVRSPFEGVVTKVSIKRGDAISNGSTVATVITHQQIATLPLNEVDVAKVKLGQKVTLTFDAVADLTLTGSVIEVDALGTTSQGVVTYTVTVGLDTPDTRVKPGMTTTASIVTDVAQDVLMVPSTAIKTQGGASVVQVLQGVGSDALAAIGGIAWPAGPTYKDVQTGLTSDTETQIMGGLQEGDLVVVRTVTASAAAKAGTQTGSLLPGSTTRGGGNATFRAAGGATGGTVQIIR